MKKTSQIQQARQLHGLTGHCRRVDPVHWRNACILWRMFRRQRDEQWAQGMEAGYNYLWAAGFVLGDTDTGYLINWLAEIARDQSKYLLDQRHAKPCLANAGQPNPRQPGTPCHTCRGTGRDPMSDTVAWLPCTSCGGKGRHLDTPAACAQQAGA